LRCFANRSARYVSGVSANSTSSSETYIALVERLRDLDGSVFTVQEAQSIRDAADARLFGDADQTETVTVALEMLNSLVEAARLSSRTCRELGDLLCAIEPARGVRS
jgi:hypothetical protein